MVIANRFVLSRPAVLTSIAFLTIGDWDGTKGHSGRKRPLFRTVLDFSIAGPSDMTMQVSEVVP